MFSLLQKLCTANDKLLLNVGSKKFSSDSFICSYCRTDIAKGIFSSFLQSDSQTSQKIVGNYKDFLQKGSSFLKHISLVRMTSMPWANNQQQNSCKVADYNSKQTLKDVLFLMGADCTIYQSHRKYCTVRGISISTLYILFVLIAFILGNKFISRSKKSCQSSICWICFSFNYVRTAKPCAMSLLQNLKHTTKV